MHVPLRRGFRGEVKADFFVNIKYDIFLSDDFPAHSRGWGLNFSFPSAEKKQNAAAASDAMKGSAKARLSLPHQPRRKKREQRGCARESC